MKLTGFSLKGQALVGSLWNPQPDLPQSQHRLGMDKRIDKRGIEEIRERRVRFSGRGDEGGETV